MRLLPFASVVVLFLMTALALAAEEPTHHEQRQEPERATPNPPRSPLRFALVKGNERQALEVKYIDADTIAFRIRKTGTCSRHEQGRATLVGNWWLGAETDENEAGEAVAVEEYIYKKNTRCTIYIRIDETAWTQATIREADQCSANCAASAAPMRPKKKEPQRAKQERN